MFKLWGGIANILSLASSRVDDAIWSDGNSANASHPGAANETATGAYLPWAQRTYGVYVSSEDQTLDQAPAPTVARPTDTDPYLIVNQELAGVCRQRICAGGA